MAATSEKIRTALNETRILMIGSQILIGLQYRSAFEPGFERLPVTPRLLKLASLVLMLVVIGLLMLASSYHRIVEGGEDRERFHGFVTGVMDLTLFPFALALGIEIFVAFLVVSGASWGIAAGSAFAAIALFFWYAVGLTSRRRKGPVKKEEEGSSETKLKDKIDHVLTETRVVLPGAQALLGFQLATVFMQDFEKLPASSKYTHLGSLVMTALAVVLLMTPAAYHRIVEKGEETEGFHRVASAFVLAAMVPLAAGMAGDLFVVVRKVTGTIRLPSLFAAAALIFFYGLWFGFTLYRRLGRAR